MHLDISDNRLSDTSIRFLAELLGKFSGFRSVNMSNLSQKTKNAENTGYIELAKALKENTSPKLRGNIPTGFWGVPLRYIGRRP